MSLLKRILLAILIGIVAAGVTFLIGLVLTLIPFAQPVGMFIQAVSPVVGVIAGLWYFITGRNPVQ